MNNVFMSMVAVIMAGLIIMALNVQGELEQFVVDGLARVFEVTQR